jgi:Xaa-Pro aminopeptidase
MPQHVNYFTGYRHGPWGTGHKPIHVWGFPFFVLGPERRLLVAPGSQEQIPRGLRLGVEALGYESDSTTGLVDERNTAGEALIQAVVAAGLEGKRIGIEGAYLGYDFVEAVQRVCKVAPLDDQIETLRLTKDDEELSLIRRAASILDAAFETAQYTLRPGVSELEVLGILQRRMLEKNGEPFIFDATCGSGPNTGSVDKLGPPTEREVEEGDLFLLDLYPVLKMYKADVTRIFVAGKPAAWQVKMHAVLNEAMRLAEGLLRPGMPAREPDAVVRQCLVQAGYGDHIVHHAGHGLGLTHPERPYIAPWEEMVLQERMVLAIEPGVYIPGLGGMRIEQNYVLWSDGAEPLSKLPFELLACG